MDIPRRRRGRPRGARGRRAVLALCTRPRVDAGRQRRVDGPSADQLDESPQGGVTYQTSATSFSPDRFPGGFELNELFLLNMTSCATGIRGGGSWEAGFILPDVDGVGLGPQALINSSAVAKNSN